jgi:hypothetical protein
MCAQGILTTLERLGKPQTAAISRRHGAGDNLFGVLATEIATAPAADPGRPTRIDQAKSPRPPVEESCGTNGWMMVNQPVDV